MPRRHGAEKNRRGVVPARCHRRILRRCDHWGKSEWHHHHLEHGGGAHLRVCCWGNHRQVRVRTEPAGTIGRNSAGPVQTQPGAANRALRDDAPCQGWKIHPHCAHCLTHQGPHRKKHWCFGCVPRHHRSKTDGREAARPGKGAVFFRRTLPVTFRRSGSWHLSRRAGWPIPGSKPRLGRDVGP